MNFIEFSKSLSNYRKTQQFNKGLELFNEYKDNFVNEIKLNKWNVFNILTIFRKTNNSHLADDFINKFNIEFNDEMVLNSYLWCLFDNIKNKVYSKRYILSFRDFLFKASQINNDYTKTAISNIFRVALNYDNKDNEYLLSVLDMFDVNYLSDIEKEYNGKTFSSDKEKYYTLKSKLLFEMRRYEECFLVSKEALEKIDNFHSNNKMWLIRRMALSQKELGEIDYAIETLTKLKQEWFIQKEIAELYLIKGDKQKAFEYLKKAIQAKTKLEYKIGVIFLLGEVLKEKDLKLAQKHFLIIKKINEKEKWKDKPQLVNELKYIDFDMEYEELKKELFKYWDSFMNLEKGKITKILHQNERGVDGFIKSKKGDFYFSLPARNKISKYIKMGVNVMFEINGDRAKVIRVGEK